MNRNLPDRSSPARHLSDDEMIDRIYGVASPEAGAFAQEHISACAECRAKAGLFERRREAARAIPRESELPEALLRAQRNRVFERIEQQPAFRMHWVPAVLAAVLLLAVALAPQIRWSKAVPEDLIKQEILGDQIFRDALTLERAEEPRAASPIRGLFEEETGKDQ